MYLMYYEGDDGKRVYTLKTELTAFMQKEDPQGRPTKSAHPARFSPDDKFSRERVTLKQRFGILPTQLPPQEH